MPFEGVAGGGEEREGRVVVMSVVTVMYWTVEGRTDEPPFYFTYCTDCDLRIANGKVSHYR